MVQQQVVGDGAGARQDMRIVALAVGRVALVAHIHKALVRQFGLQRLQHAQAAHAAVKHADGALLHVALGQGRQTDWMLMFLNSPVAIFFCHSAGPVVWALVPPASTATVTGMSTTSNS